MKDGVLTVNGKEYVFHKAQGEYEWQCAVTIQAQPVIDWFGVAVLRPMALNRRRVLVGYSPLRNLPYQKTSLPINLSLSTILDCRFVQVTRFGATITVPTGQALIDPAERASLNVRAGLSGRIVRW